jgi:hypothetical protein
MPAYVAGCGRCGKRSVRAREERGFHPGGGSGCPLPKYRSTERVLPLDVTETALLERVS